MGTYIAYKVSGSTDKIDKVVDKVREVLDTSLKIKLLDKEYPYHITLIYDEEHDVNEIKFVNSSLNKEDITLTGLVDILEGHDNRKYIILSLRLSGECLYAHSFLLKVGFKHSYNDFYPHITLGVIEDTDIDMGDIRKVLMDVIPTVIIRGIDLTYYTEELKN